MNRSSNNKQQLNEAINPFAAIIKFLSSLLGAFVGTALKFTSVFGRERGVLIAQNVENLEKTSIKAIQRSDSNNKEQAIQQIKVLRQNHEQVVAAAVKEKNPQQVIEQATEQLTEKTREVLQEAKVSQEDASAVEQAARDVVKNVSESPVVNKEEATEDLQTLIKHYMDSEEARIAVIQSAFKSLSKQDSNRIEGIKNIEIIVKNAPDLKINLFIAINNLNTLIKNQYGYEPEAFKRYFLKTLSDRVKIPEEKIKNLFEKYDIEDDQKKFDNYFYLALKTIYPNSRRLDNQSEEVVAQQTNQTSNTDDEDDEEKSIKENRGNKFMDINKLRLLIIEQRAEMAMNPSQPPMDMTGEPDYEGGMARNELKTAARDAMALVEKLKESDQLPAWCQSKITMASEYIQTVKEYLESEMDDGSQEEQY
jgi:hypothetical protein